MATGRRRGRAFIYIALILILLLVLVFAVTKFGGVNIPGLTKTDNNVSVPAPTPTVQQDTVEIVMTTQDVRRGQELTEDLVQLVSIPRADYTEGVFFNSVDDVIGSRVRYDMTAHTFLTSAVMVGKDKVGSVPSFEIPKGMVAISIPVSKLSSLSYGLQKGDHVNVIASLYMVDLDTEWQSELPNRTGIVIAPGPINENQTNVTAVLQSPEEYTVSGGTAYSYLGRIEIDATMNNPVYLLPSESQRPRLVSQTLIQDVVILQMGAFTSTSTSGTPGQGTDPQAQPTQVVEGETQAPQPEVVISDVATLIVTPQDAVTLNYLMLSNVNLNLVLRSAGDDQKIDTEAVTLQFVLDQHRIPVPAKLPYGNNPRIDSAPEQIFPFPEPGTRNTPTPTGD